MRYWIVVAALILSANCCGAAASKPSGVTGPAAKRFVEADKLRKARKFEEARAIYEKIAAAPWAAAAVKGAAKHELEMLKTEIAVAKWQWTTSLLPDNEYAGWAGPVKGWTVEKGVITCGPGAHGRGLYYDYSFPAETMIEAEFEPMPDAVSQSLPVGFCVRREGSQLLTVFLSKSDGKLIIKDAGKTCASVPIKGLKSRNTIAVTVAARVVDVMVNGRPVVISKTLSQHSNSMKVGLGCAYTRTGGAVRIRRFRARAMLPD